MRDSAPPLRGSVRVRLRRFSQLMGAVVALTIAALLACHLWLQRSAVALEEDLLPHWKMAQQLYSDARALSAQATRLPLALSEGELDTVRARVASQMQLLEEDLARLEAHTGLTGDSAALALSIAKLQDAIARASSAASQRVALGWGAALSLEVSHEVNALRRIERDLARLVDEQTVVLSSYASALATDSERLLDSQRSAFALQRWLQTLLILFAGLGIGLLLMAQSRLLERRLLRRIDQLRQTMASGSVDERLLHADGRDDELDAMQVELARLLNRLTEQNQALEQLAATDTLTRLANRRALHERLALEVMRQQRYAQPLSLLAIDIDHFKQVNDTWGHAAGDRVLQDLAQILCSGARQSDLVARYGGEEFIVVLPGSPREGAEAMAEHLRARVVAQRFSLPGGATVPVSISIGSATLAAGESADSMLARADAALYRAKHLGRNRVCLAPEPSAPEAAPPPEAPAAC